MSNAYLTRMPAGIPGDVSRKEVAKIEPGTMNTLKPVTAYGVPVKMVSGKFEPIASGDTILGLVKGFAVRPYPMQAQSSEALGVATPNPTQPLDILRSGYITVKCNGGTPAKGGIVYCRKTAGAGETLGGVEAAADGTDCEAIDRAFFMGAADASGNVEIEFNV